MATFLLGAYTPDMDGTASGIGVLFAGAPDDALAGGPLGFAGEAVTTGGSPSWVARHPALDVVLAALEGDGSVRAFRRTGETSFVRLGEPVAVGESPCHVAIAPDGRFLVASCWGDGRVVRVALDAAGRPSAAVAAETATDPYGAGGAERPSHAHETLFLPGGLIATTDMGFDLVRFWRDGADGLRPGQQVVLPYGCGPRHMVWHPSGHLYVIAELSCEVFVLAPDAEGIWRVVGGSPLGAGTLPGDAAAEIALSRDAEFVYAGARGSNTIATLRVRGSGSSLAPIALVESGVDWPRHHLVVRDSLLVAGQRSDDVVSLGLDLRTGIPGRVRHRAAAPSPSCILPLR